MKTTQGRRLNHSAVIGVTLSLTAALAAGGCASGGRASVASGARSVGSGVGTVEYTATGDGSVYVLDATSNRLVALGGVTAGQVVRADAATDEVTIGGKVITRSPISDKARHEILFRPDAKRAR